MQNSLNNKYKLFITSAIVLAFVWFLVIFPMITFHNNEKKLEEAAKRYFELNQNELPTGERIKKVSLSTLYHKYFLEKDLYIPYTKKTCSIENSWVKVKKDNNNIKYYTYLECGVLTSLVDHKGPKITLNGQKDITINIGEEFTDPGIKSVVDNRDGKMKISNVTVKGKVKENEIGNYEIEYIASDSLNNKTIETRKITVVQKLNNTILKDLKDTNNYVGNPKNNYIRFSNMMFRIYGLDSNQNAILISDEDIANINYTKIDNWLNYYYNHLTDDAKKLIVESTYCNMTLTDTTLDTTNCQSFTTNKKVYIPSVIDVNKAEANGENFMKPFTISWVSNLKNSKEAYITRNIFFDEDKGKSFLPYNVKHNYGVRPMLTVKGDTLILDGNGTEENPYIIINQAKAKGGSSVNERFTGEYISIDGEMYRIIETNKDGTTKVISESTIGDLSEMVQTTANYDSEKIVYDINDKKSVAYYINNRISQYIDVSYFTKHEIEVPIYKKDIIYGEEVKVNKQQALLSAPNMYDMFAAQPQRDNDCYSYWLLNSSKEDRTTGAIYYIGVPLNQKIPNYMALQIRLVAYLKKGTVISSGAGTFEKPYLIK